MLVDQLPPDSHWAMASQLVPEAGVGASCAVALVLFVVVGVGVGVWLMVVWVGGLVCVWVGGGVCCAPVAAEENAMMAAMMPDASGEAKVLGVLFYRLRVFFLFSGS